MYFAVTVAFSSPERNRARAIPVISMCSLMRDCQEEGIVKRFILVSWVGLLAVGLTGCAISDGQRAQNTAQAFVEAMSREDRQAIKETVTARAWANLSGGNENKEPNKEQPTYSVGQAVITDDTAQVPITATENGKETPLHIKLRREDHEWRVYAMSVPSRFGGSELTIDFEHPEEIYGEVFKGMGQAMGAMFKGMGEGLGSMFKGMQEGMQNAGGNGSANASDNAPPR